MQKDKKLLEATFAGGCFWCLEHPFKAQRGVVEVFSGYVGGTVENPTYEQVSSGVTGHYEAIQVLYDPQKVNYETLLEIFWRQIDPTDPGGQFADRGSQYRTAIFYHTEEQKKLVLSSKENLDKSGRFSKPIVTSILPSTPFYPAEEYHQDYSQKNPLRYQWYRMGSGRDEYLEGVWKGKNPKNLSKEELQQKLTPLQYKVTQEGGTESPFQNEFWNNKKEGIYVDVVSGEPLFSSLDKFNSGTGWPSFSKPIELGHLLQKEDKSLFQTRTEVLSKEGYSHLGHVFADGPTPTGLRYCINSAALRFIPKEDLEKEGYGKYRVLFDP